VKNYDIWSTIAVVIVKVKVASFAISYLRPYDLTHCDQIWYNNILLLLLLLLLFYFLYPRGIWKEKKWKND